MEMVPIIFLMETCNNFHPLFLLLFRYDGEWKQGKKDGLGTLKYSSGAKYEGEFKEDQANGKGKFYFLNGDYYNGQWKNG